MPGDNDRSVRLALRFDGPFSWVHPARSKTRTSSERSQGVGRVWRSRLLISRVRDAQQTSAYGSQSDSTRAGRCIGLKNLSRLFDDAVESVAP